MNKPSQHRELSRRQHRILALELTLQAWIHQADGIILSRVELSRFLGITRFEASRISAIKQDMKPFFPYQVILGRASSFSALVLSRVSLSNLPSGTMTSMERAKRCRERGLRIEYLLELDNYDSKEKESERFSRIALLAAGLSELSILEKDYLERHATEDIPEA